MQRHLLVIDRVLALAAFRAVEEEASLARALRLDAEEVARRADRKAAARRGVTTTKAGDDAVGRADRRPH
jgi:hypothetical protein